MTHGAIVIPRRAKRTFLELGSEDIAIDVMSYTVRACIQCHAALGNDCTGALPGLIDALSVTGAVVVGHLVWLACWHDELIL